MVKIAGNFVKPKTGAKKQAPVNMRNEAHQFVIDGYLVDEVLSQLPPTIQIIQACIRVHKIDSSRKLVVPNALRKLGVGSMWSRGAAIACQIMFDQTSKENIKQKVAAVCKQMGFNRPRAYFKYIVLANAVGTLKFEQCTKEIKPDETDLRKKLRVLGATVGQGQVQNVIATLNAKKYKCVIKEEPVKFVMCYKE